MSSTKKEEGAAKNPAFGKRQREFFARYLYANQELIAEEIQRTCEEK